MTRKWGFALVLAAAVLVLSTQGVMADDDGWQFGLGTGLYGLNIDGDIGVNADVNGLKRGYDTDIDLSSSEIQDYADSAFGLVGFARKGKWGILYGGGFLNLEDDNDGLDAEWERSSFELAGNYTFWTGERNRVGVLFGVRYTSHDWDLDGRPRVRGVPTRVRADFDEDWVDGFVGLTHGMQLGDKWSWTSRLELGGGGSDGSVLIQSGMNWKFAEHWMLTFYFKNLSVDYENGSKGDSDYYMYDVSEFGGGVGITLLW